MSNKQARVERRAAERKAAKEKQEKNLIANASARKSKQQRKLDSLKKSG